MYIYDSGCQHEEQVTMLTAEIGCILFYVLLLRICILGPRQHFRTDRRHGHLHNPLAPFFVHHLIRRPFTRSSLTLLQPLLTQMQGCLYPFTSCRSAPLEVLCCQSSCHILASLAHLSLLAEAHAFVGTATRLKVAAELHPAAIGHCKS